MCTSRTWWQASIWLLTVALLPSAALAESPLLGVPLTETEVAQLDFTILPDGTGLPAGSGNAAVGETLYRQHCVACHGAGGEGGANGQLVGGVGSIGTDAPVKTVGSYWPYATTIFDYLRRAMPYQTPAELGTDELYALTAYLLHANGIIGAEEDMNAETLPRVEMPNRNGFNWAVPQD